jgi:hypothetical protein
VKHRGHIAWSFFAPGDWERETELAAQLSEFRGRELWAGGRRPAFAAGGSFADPHPADAASHHVIAREGRRIVGCIRATPVEHPATELRALLGPGGLRRTLVDDAGKPLADGRCYEVGRWIVDSHLRRTRLGIQLGAAIWAVCICERWDSMACIAGTRDGQMAMLTRSGARPVANLGLIHSAEYDDDLRVLYFMVSALPGELGPIIDGFLEPCREQLGRRPRA